MEEEFKEIELYGKTYKVSNHGRFIGARGELKQRLNRNGYVKSLLVVKTIETVLEYTEL